MGARTCRMHQGRGCSGLLPSLEGRWCVSRPTQKPSVYYSQLAAMRMNGAKRQDTGYAPLTVVLPRFTHPVQALMRTVRGKLQRYRYPDTCCMSWTSTDTNSSGQPRSQAVRCWCSTCHPSTHASIHQAWQSPMSPPMAREAELRQTLWGLCGTKYCMLTLGVTSVQRQQATRCHPGRCKQPTATVQTLSLAIACSTLGGVGRLVTP